MNISVRESGQHTATAPRMIEDLWLTDLDRPCSVPRPIRYKRVGSLILGVGSSKGVRGTQVVEAAFRRRLENR